MAVEEKKAEPPTLTGELTSILERLENLDTYEELRATGEDIDKIEMDDATRSYVYKFYAGAMQRVMEPAESKSST